MAFNGDMVALKRKHTSGLDLRVELHAAIQLYLKHYGNLKREVDVLAARAITDTEAKAAIFDVVFGRKALPLRLGDQVGQEYFNPRHAEFEPRTMWSLHNAFTEVVKQITGRDGQPSLSLQMEANQAIGRYFGLLGA